MNCPICNGPSLRPDSPLCGREECAKASRERFVARLPQNRPPEPRRSVKDGAR